MIRWQPQAPARIQTVGSATATSSGTLVTPAVGSKGSWTSLGTTAMDLHHTVVSISANGGDGNILVDLGIDHGSGVVSIIAADLCDTYRANYAFGAAHHLPLYIPRGVALVARAQSGNTNVASVQVIGSSRGILGLPGYPRCHRLHTPDATGRYGVVLDAGGTINIKGSWTEINASLPRPIRSLTLSLDYAGIVAARSAQCVWRFDIGVGSAGSEQVIIPQLHASIDGTLYLISPTQLGPFPCDLPAGSRLVARTQANTTSAGNRTFGLNAWGCGP